MSAEIKIKHGTEETREFYDREGWHHSDGKLRDVALFGVKEDGPIRVMLYKRRVERTLEILGTLGNNLNLVELGCGGSPATKLRPLIGHYTGVDFSSQGLSIAADKVVDFPHTLVESDITVLPLADDAYDVVYSAHVLYHIDTPQGQATAIREALRVLRPGGIGVFVLANPWPLAFPGRMLMRLVASTPMLNRIARRVRKSSLPYLPMRRAWYIHQMRSNGATVNVECYGMHSTWFNQRVSETSQPGKTLWRLLAWCETGCPRMAARLGNYLLYIARKD